MLKVRTKSMQNSLRTIFLSTQYTLLQKKYLNVKSCVTLVTRNAEKFKPGRWTTFGKVFANSYFLTKKLC